MKNFCLTSLFFCLVLPAVADGKERVNIAATYEVTAESFIVNPRKERWFEVWHVTGVVDVEEDPDYTKTIRNYTPSGRPQKASEEIEHTLGRKITRLSSFTELFWWKHPNMLDHGESTFGHYEERDYEQGPVKEKLPLFVSATRISANLMRTDFKIFLPEGQIYIVSEIFSSTSYHLPVEKVVQILSPMGTTLSRIVYTRTK